MAISVFAKVPIEGRTSGTIHPAQIGLNSSTVFSASKSGGSITANTVIPSWTTTEVDTSNGFNATTGIYTIRSPGDYILVANLRTTTGEANDSTLDVYKNNALYKVGTDAHFGGGTCIAVMPNLSYGDTIDLRCQNSRIVTTETRATRFELYKINSNSQPYAPRIAYLKDVKANNIDGGTHTAGSYQTRVLNTLEGDVSFVSLASNQFTLQPGTYHIEASAPAARVNRHIVKLRNISDSVDTILGSSSNADSTVSPGGDSVESQTISTLAGVFSISTAKTFEIQHRGTTTQATIGFGYAANFGNNELYTQVKITKVL
jgi:hypothetical protein